MTKAKAAKSTGDTKSKPLVVEAEKGETEAATMARVMTAPYLRHGIVTSSITEKMMGKLPGEPRFDDFAHVIKAKSQATGSGDLALASEMLTAQAITLDAIFTEMSRRAAMNMGEYLDASERYARLAFKAQGNCRATLEALAKLHQPREQTVRHVHVNEGANAIVADQFHHHAGSAENGNSAEQSYAPEQDCQVGGGAALPGPHPLRNGVPIPSRKGKAAMQDARRN